MQVVVDPQLEAGFVFVEFADGEKVLILSAGWSEDRLVHSKVHRIIKKYARVS